MIGAWRLALRNLQRNSRRNIATGLAVALGFSGLVVVGGYIIRIDRYLATAAVYLAHTGHVAIYKRDGIEMATTKPKRYSLTREEQSVIEQVLAADTNVEFSAAYLQGIGLIGNGCRAIPFVGQGVEPAAANFVRNHPQVISQLPELRKPLRGRGIGEAKANAVSVTGSLARRLGKPHVDGEAGLEGNSRAIDCKDTTAVSRIASTASVQLLGATFSGSFTAVEATLSGIHTTGLAELEDSSLVTSLGVMQEIFETDKVTYVGVYVKDDEDLDAYRASLQSRLNARGIEVSVYPFSDERLSPYYVGAHAFLNVMGMFIGTIILVVIVLSIVSSTTMTVIERSHEIGSLRSIGFRHSNVRSLFMREVFALSVFAVLGGLLFSVAACTIVNSINFRFSPPGISGDMQFMLHPTPLLSLLTAALVLVISCVGTLLAIRGRLAMKVSELNAAVAG